MQVVPNDAAKMPWLKAQLPTFVDAGDVLVFANQKARVEEVCQQLSAAGFRCGLLETLVCCACAAVKPCSLQRSRRIFS